MPTRDEVELAVKMTIAGFTRLPINQVGLDLKLRNPSSVSGFEPVSVSCDVSSRLCQVSFKQRGERY